MAKNVAEPGSVSSGTTRTEDLIPAFLDALTGLDPVRAAKIEREYGYADGGFDPDGALAAEMLYELFDALEDHAPEGYYFGAHPGDGADYGFWPVDE